MRQHWTGVVAIIDCNFAPYSYYFNYRLAQCNPHLSQPNILYLQFLVGSINRIKPVSLYYLLKARSDSSCRVVCTSIAGVLKNCWELYYDSSGFSIHKIGRWIAIPASPPTWAARRMKIAPAKLSPIFEPTRAPLCTGSFANTSNARSSEMSPISFICNSLLTQTIQRPRPPHWRNFRLDAHAPGHCQEEEN